MAILKRKDFLNRTLKTRTVAIPAYGGEVIIREMSLSDRDQFERSSVKGEGKNAQVDMTQFRARLLAFTAVDEEGQRIFTEEDIPMLAGLPATELIPAADAAMQLSGFSQSDVEELAKN